MPQEQKTKVTTLTGPPVDSKVGEHNYNNQDLYGFMVYSQMMLDGFMVQSWIYMDLWYIVTIVRCGYDAAYKPTNITGGPTLQVFTSRIALKYPIVMNMKFVVRVVKNHLKKSWLRLEGTPIERREAVERLVTHIQFDQIRVSWLSTKQVMCVGSLISIHVCIHSTVNTESIIQSEPKSSLSKGILPVVIDEI